MANNYTQFSVKYFPPQYEKRNLQEDVVFKGILNFKLEELEKGDFYTPGYRIEKDGVWIYAEESEDIEAAIKLVQILQNYFNDDSPFILTWADWCSKPRLDEFGGGGAVITKNNYKFMCAHEWCSKEAEKTRKKLKGN